jgi:hypothetical protein
LVLFGVRGMLAATGTNSHCAPPKRQCSTVQHSAAQRQHSTATHTERESRS